MSEDSRDCFNCKYCWCECGEDIVCGHPESYKETSFGRSVNYARREGNFCGPEGKLFEIRSTKGTKNATP